MTDYMRPSISNGIPREQALIRRWWHEHESARGRLVWEYYLEGKFADAIWFPDEPGHAIEEPGQHSQQRFPLSGREIVVCEAKVDLTPELIGQALVYAQFARHAGATVRETRVFAETGPQAMQRVARELNLTPVVWPLET